MAAFRFFGGWPVEVLYDNMKQLRLGRDQWNQLFMDFVGHYGIVAKTHRIRRPRTNGKIERWHKTLKADAIRPGQPDSLDQARTRVARFVEHYNNVRLHSAIGYIAPADLLAGRATEIWAARDARLEAAREARRLRRAAEAA